MTVHAFVDETKDRGYLVAAALLLPEDLAHARRVLAGLLLPGQRRLHLVKERDSRRGQIVAAMALLPVEVVVYDASDVGDGPSQRAACLRSLVGDLVKRDARLLVLERDDSIVDADLRVLYQAVRGAGCAESLLYRHLRAHEEPLLAIPDAIAWCWARGGKWRKRVEALIAEVRSV